MFIILNEKERDDFEKMYQIPYGYARSVGIFKDFDKAVEHYDLYMREMAERGSFSRSDFIIEEYVPNSREMVYNYTNYKQKIV